MRLLLNVRGYLPHWYYIRGEGRLEGHAHRGLYGVRGLCCVLSHNGSGGGGIDDLFMLSARLAVARLLYSLSTLHTQASH